MGPRLSSPLQASFRPDLFQASLFQLEKLAQGRKQAEGMVFGERAGAELSSGIRGDVWRRAELQQAGLSGEGEEKPLESLRTLSHHGKTELVSDLDAWKLLQQVDAAPRVPPSPPHAAPGERADAQRDPKAMAAAAPSGGGGARHQPQLHVA